MKRIKFSNVFLVNPEGKILILRRTQSHPTRPLALDLPGGGLEPGEDFQRAAIREVKEETGLDIPPSELHLIRYKEVVQSGRSLKGAIYRATIPQSEMPVLLSSEHDQYSWILPGRLKNLPEFHQKSLNFALLNGYLN